MTRSTRVPLTIRIALTAACPALSVLALAMSAGAQAAGVPVVHYTHESFGAYEKQLSAGQIEAATFNKKAHTLHLALKDGRHVLVSYPSHEEPRLAAKLQARGVPVTVEKKAKKPVKAVHHKLRYIAGGIVIVVIFVVAAVLLVDRRRRLGEAGEGASAPSSPGDAG